MYRLPSPRVKPTTRWLQWLGPVCLVWAAMASTAGADDLESRLQDAAAHEQTLAQWTRQVEAGEFEEVLEATHGAENDPRVFNLRGLSLAGLERFADAVKAFESGIRLDPSLPELHLNLATTLLATGAGGRAMAEFEDAARRAPEWVDARLGLGRSLLRFRRYPRAREELAAALRLAPGDVRVLTAWANWQEVAGEPADALEAWRRVDAVDPTADTAEHLAGLLVAVDAAGAEAAWRDCLDRDPTRGDCAGSLGTALLARGQPQEAAELLTQAIDQESTPSLLHNLVLALQIMGDATALERVVREYPPAQGATWGVVATARRTAGKSSLALEAAQLAVAAAPQDLELVNLLAVLLDENGQSQKAIERWRWILSQDPDHARARQNLESRRG